MTSDERTNADLPRTEQWTCDGPATLDLSMGFGQVEVTLVEQASTVKVELRHDPGTATGWSQGLSGLLGGWLGESTGRGGFGQSWSFSTDRLDPGIPFGQDLGEEAVRATEIRWAQTRRELVMRSPSAIALRAVPLAVSVHAPAQSRLILRSAGSVNVTGRAGDTVVRSGFGDITLGIVDGNATLTGGSGTVNVDAIRGRANAKTGSGDLRLAELGGPAEVRSGSGDVRLGRVHADLRARTGSGNLTIDDAQAGCLELTMGSGDLRVGVHAGVAAELDLSSGSGRARSDLEVGHTAPADGTKLIIRGRTGNGDVWITKALVTTG